MSIEQTEEVRTDMGSLTLAILKSSFRIILVTLVLLVATYFILQFVPKKYTSSASILVETRASVFTRANNDNSFASGSLVDPTIIKSHVALIKSRDIISRVVTSENLLEVDELNGNRSSSFNRIMSLFTGEASSKSLQERVIFAVAKRTRVIQLPESRVITIYFKSLDPELSARVANAIANAHVARRSELSVSDTSEASEWLLSQIEEMRTLVAKAEAKVAAYRVDNDLFVGSNNTSILDQQLTNISTQITAAQERKSLAKSRAELIRGLINTGRSIDGVPDVRNSVVVQRLAQDKARLQGELAQLLATRLPNHPDIKARSAQIAEIDKQIRQEGIQVANSLEAQAQIEKDIEQSLRDDLTRLKIDVSGATKSSVALSELEREAKVQQDLLATYLSRYRDAAARSKPDAVLPDVRVITSAAPALRASSPKKGFILLAVGFLSIVLQFSSVLFKQLLSAGAVREVHPYREMTFVQDMVPANSASKDSFASNSDPEYIRENSANNVNIANDVIAPAAPNSTLATPPASTPSSISNPKMQNNYNMGFSDDEIEAKNIFSHISNVSDYISNSNAPIFVASLKNADDAQDIVKAISDNLTAKQKSVVEVDAGSRKISTDQGITDLCDNEAEFGDVVQRSSNSNLAYVAWGQKNTLNIHSKNAKTLVSALSEIFEIVLVNVGRYSMASSLPAFVGGEGQILLIVDKNDDPEQINNIGKDVTLMGFSGFNILKVSSSQVKVA